MKWFSRLSLLWKILLSTSVAMTAIFFGTGQIVLSHISRTMWSSLDEEVQNSFRTYKSVLDSRTDLLAAASRLLSTIEPVRLAVSTGDRATIQDTASEFWSKVSIANAIVLVADPRGQIITSLGGITEFPLEERLDVVPKAAAKFPLQSSGFFLRKGELYHISITPVYLDSIHQPVLHNVLVTGYHMDALVAQELKARTNSDFLFLPDHGVVTSTLNPHAREAVLADIRRRPGSERVSDGVVQYARLVTPLPDITGKSVGEICILRSFEGAQRRISGLYTNIVLMWVLAVLVAFALTYMLARRIVEPVKQLDRAAAEVARQNYAIQVDVTSEDEMGRLARTFNTMCASIRQAREDLIRQERISTIGRLSSSIVHDLRNPLAAIYGGAEMLVDGDLPPSHVKRLAGNIYRASRRIQELLSDLLNVSRGKTNAPELCRLREVVTAACESLQPAAEAQGVQVSVSVPGEIEVPLDRSRMERTFVNLIGNALEAMPGGGEVHIKATLDGESVTVQVEDTGPGIAPEIRSKLFQPFVSAGKRNGLGLGLALSRQTVLELGGDMWVDSEPGRGARFIIRLRGAQVAHPQSLTA